MSDLDLELELEVRREVLRVLRVSFSVAKRE